MFIDVHHHAVPRPALELVGRDPVYRVEVNGRSWRGGNHVDFEVAPEFIETEAKLAQLDGLGIHGAIVSAMPPLFYYEIGADAGAALCEAINAGLAEMSAESGGRLWWIANVPLQDPARAVDTLHEAAREGAVGAHIGTSIAGRRLDEPELDVFWAAAAEAGLPVEIHPDFTYDRVPALAPYYLANVIGLPLETTIAIERLICAGVLDRHPGLRLVFLHGGGFFPYQAGRLRHARTVRPELAEAPVDPWSYAGQIVIDTITHDPQALAYLISRMGADNVVLGTDIPFDMAPPDPVGLLRAGAGGDPTVMRKVGAANAARLWRLDVRALAAASA